MNLIAAKHIELLKNEVLLVSGFKTITPADCKIISINITSKTKQTVSETTLKRVYGFALSKFNPSLFTIDVMARYCGYIGWSDFVAKQESEALKKADDNLDWSTLQQNAGKITNFTLQALKNKSGIPYNQTIERRFLDRHIDEFLNSDHTGTFLAAPAGYGKTIALCHWVEKKIVSNQATGENDIILFFSSNALMSVLLSGRDINDWMLSLLGYSNHFDLNNLSDIQQRKTGKFYLIVDGLDEHMFKNEQFEILLNHITDIFSFYQSHDWFKLIITMRSSTCINNRHEMEKSVNTWFTNFTTNDACINVPLFSIIEIKELCYKINPLMKSFVDIEIAENFNHPLYFQFYYKQHKQDFTLNNIDHLCIYELVSIFILNKVYLGQHSAEKILLIEKLVAEMDIASSCYRVDKLKVNSLLKQYYHAYNELIGIGFLRETNDSDNYQYSTYIQFGNDNFLDHSIAKTLLYYNHDRFDSILIQKINQLFANNSHKMDVLKWCVIYAIKTSQMDSFERLTEVSLNANEKSDLILFLGDLLNKEYSSMKKTESLMHYFKQDFNKKMFYYFFGLEFINLEYKKTLNTLLRFEMSNRKKILVYSSLTVISLINLDLNEANNYITKLKSFTKDDFLAFPINPLKCLDAIYSYFKSGIIKKAAIIELTKFCFCPPSNTETFEPTVSNDFLYLLSVYTLILCNNPRKSLRFINSLNSRYRNELSADDSSHYHYFIDVLTADDYYLLGDKQAVANIHDKISKLYNDDEQLLTPYMKTLFHSMRIKHMICGEQWDSIPGELKLLNIMSEESGAKFSKVYVYRLILKTEALKAAIPEFYRQVKYSLNKIIVEAGINVETLVTVYD